MPALSFNTQTLSALASVGSHITVCVFWEPAVNLIQTKCGRIHGKSMEVYCLGARELVRE